MATPAASLGNGIDLCADVAVILVGSLDKTASKIFVQTLQYFLRFGIPGIEREEHFFDVLDNGERRAGSYHERARRDGIGRRDDRDPEFFVLVRY